MWVTNAPTAVLSIITGGGKWVELTIPADPLYQHLLLTAEKKFWRCVESGERPHLFSVEPPPPRIEACRIVDMSASNTWADLASRYRLARVAATEHERAKSELKALMPRDAKEASGHGVRAKRSKSGSVSFELLANGGGEAALRWWRRSARGSACQGPIRTCEPGKIPYRNHSLPLSARVVGPFDM